MGLFKTTEEKQAEKNEKIKKWLSKRGLDKLSPDYYDQVSRIKTYLWGANVISSLGNEKELLRNIAHMTNGINEQNWLLIKQNDELIKQNKELINLLKNK